MDSLCSIFQREIDSMYVGTVPSSPFDQSDSLLFSNWHALRLKWLKTSVAWQTTILIYME